MIEEVVSIDLPVHERLVIKKNRLEPENVTGREKRISIVTGTHGDELDGQYVCYEIIRRILQHPEKLKGIVGTKVSIQRSKGNKGKIEIEYYSQDELERIIELFETMK